MDKNISYLGGTKRQTAASNAPSKRLIWSVSGSFLIIFVFDRKIREFLIDFYDGDETKFRGYGGLYLFIRPKYFDYDAESAVILVHFCCRRR